ESAGDAEEGVAELPEERTPQSVDEYRGPVLRLPPQNDFPTLTTSDLDRTGSQFAARPTLAAVPRLLAALESSSSHGLPQARGVEAGLGKRVADETMVASSEEAEDRTIGDQQARESRESRGTNEAPTPNRVLSYQFSAVPPPMAATATSPRDGR